MPEENTKLECIRDIRRYGVVYRVMCPETNRGHCMFITAYLEPNNILHCNAMPKYICVNCPIVKGMEAMFNKIILQKEAKYCAAKLRYK